MQTFPESLFDMVPLLDLRYRSAVPSRWVRNAPIALSACVAALNLPTSVTNPCGIPIHTSNFQGAFVAGTLRMLGCITSFQIPFPEDGMGAATPDTPSPRTCRPFAH